MKAKQTLIIIYRMCSKLCRPVRFNCILHFTCIFRLQVPMLLMITMAIHRAYFRIFNACNFARVAFSIPAFSVAPSRNMK